MAYRGAAVLRKVVPRSQLYILSSPITLSNPNSSKFVPNVTKASPSLQIRAMSTSTSAKGIPLDTPFFKPELVIFDKDGTLICFHTMWTPWCTSLAERLNKVTGVDLSGDVYDLLGYDHGEQRVKLGVLAENTHNQIKDKLAELLTNNLELSPSKANTVIEKSWQDTPENLKIKLTGNLQALFIRLKKNGIKIAICTSDSREGTEQFLIKENLSHYVDLVVCGDDPDSKPKPDPHNASLICRKLGVDPTKTIMVGDTPADTLFGQQAKLGLTVGVLTGIGTQHELADADVIVSDVNECVEMILPKSPGEGNRKKVYHVTTRGISKIAMGSMFQQDFDSVAFGKRRFSTSSVANKGFSHIIVGAGSAGCVLSNRLTEDRQI